MSRPCWGLLSCDIAARTDRCEIVPATRPRLSAFDSLDAATVRNAWGRLYYDARIMSSHLLAAVVALLSFAQAPPDRQSPVDEIFKEFTVPGSPGCTVARLPGRQNGAEPRLRHGESRPRRASRTVSVFHVASVSKQFTAAAILLLAHDGKLALDDDIRKHVPELPDFGKRITIRHLDPSHQRYPRPVGAARPGRLALLARSHH